MQELESELLNDIEDTSGTNPDENNKPFIHFWARIWRKIFYISELPPIPQVHADSFDKERTHLYDNDCFLLSKC